MFPFVSFQKFVFYEQHVLNLTETVIYSSSQFHD